MPLLWSVMLDRMGVDGFLNIQLTSISIFNQPGDKKTSLCNNDRIVS